MNCKITYMSMDFLLWYTWELLRTSYSRNSKTFGIRPFRATSSCFAAHKVKKLLLQAESFLTFEPGITSF